MKLPPANIGLLGYRGSGKTAVGRLLATELDWSFIDSDQILQQQAGLTIAEIFTEWGEKRFRDQESEILAQHYRDVSTVISLGGGVVEREANRKMIRRMGAVIWLSAEPAELAERLQRDPLNRTQRPPLSNLPMQEEIKVGLTRRAPMYQALANLTIDTTGLNPAEVVQMISRWLVDNRSRQ